MIKGFTQSPSEMVCRIKSFCLILSTIMFLVFIAGCGNVRGLKNGHYTEKSQNENVKNTETELTEEDAQESDNSQDNKNIQPKNSKLSKRLPTLKEQIRKLQTDQEALTAKVNVLQSDVDDIKSTLYDIKAVLLNRADGRNQEVISGIKTKKDNIILPDSLCESNPASEKKTNTNKILPKWKPIPKDGIIFSDENTEKPQQQNKTIQKEKPAPPRTTINRNNKRVLVKRTEATQEPKKIEPEKQINVTKVNSNISLVQQDLGKKNYQEAIQKLNSIVENETQPEVIQKCNYLLGESNFGLKQYAQAIIYYEKVLKSKFPDNKDNAQIMIAESRFRSGQVIEAKKAYEVFVQKYPTSELLPKARKMLQQL